jgi:hypothetical protein
MADKVFCHSEAMYAERPVSFEWQESILQVVEVLQRWRIPQGIQFRVLAGDQQVYDLFYSLLEDDWQVTQL